MEIVCSAIAGIFARVLCHPLDTIKTVAFTGFAGEHQINPAAAGAAATTSTSHAAAKPITTVPREVPRTSFLSSARSIQAREGMAGFYRGVGVAALGSAPGVALYLTTYDRCCAAWKAFGESTPTGAAKERGGDNIGSKATSLALESLRTAAANTPTSVRFFVCGLAAETVSCLVWVPIDVSKERLQSQPPSLQARYTSSLDALQRILANEGVRGLYKGYWSTLGSFGPFSAAYFVFYEYLTSMLKNWCVASSLFRPTHGEAFKPTNSVGDAGLSSTARFAVALGAGAGGNLIASILTNPLELVKTRLQVQRAVLYCQAATPDAAAHPRLYAYHYDGLLDGLSQMARTEGVRALWRGVGARVAYTAPNAALTMGFFELLKSKLL